MSRTTRWKALAVLVGLAAVAVVAWQGLSLRESRRLDERGRAAISIAEDQVLDLTTLDSKTVKQKLEAMAHRTTGDFSQQLDSIAQSFVDSIVEAKLTSEGHIDAAALKSIEERSASVLVAASVLVTNKKQAEPSSRSYRMKINLVWTEDEWLIEKMEFVA